jgi:hypothetical protein
MFAGSPSLFRCAAQLVFALAVAAFASATAATPCYVILDHNDNVIYQSSRPPLDLSEEGDQARAALRQRGEYLLNFDSMNCQDRLPPKRSATSQENVDAIVAEVKPLRIVPRRVAIFSPMASNSNIVPSTSGGEPPLTLNVGR